LSEGCCWLLLCIAAVLHCLASLLPVAVNYFFPFVRSVLILLVLIYNVYHSSFILIPQLRVTRGAVGFIFFNLLLLPVKFYLRLIDYLSKSYPHSFITTELLSWMLVFPCIPDGQHIRLNDQLRCRIVLVTFSIVPRLRLMPSLCHLPDQPLHTHTRSCFQLTILEIRLNFEAGSENKHCLTPCHD
jgi:hypothetical protein